MNVNLNSKQARALNIYESSAGYYTTGRSLKYKLNDPEALVDLDGLPRLKDGVDKEKYKTPVGYISKGRAIAPDELLYGVFNVSPDDLKYLTREEIKGHTGVDLPSSELLKSLHYYFAERIQNDPTIPDSQKDTLFTRFCDGSALLAMGVLVEKWINDFVGQQRDIHKHFMELDEVEDLTDVLKRKRRLDYYRRKRLRRHPDPDLSRST
ncbi:hypothetical protein KL918_001874 [Ogataea parapolymorpha]|uniref:Uncharacterized protein n=1 Tax=Ogataea parapolymorpha (strain ATCC 26012 / BCRC 20466 / JCM 22074 / NRRL Y-7560 / DL-1) TaxID=871575 RepID=W1QDT1_OGAPD|nr:hypothetical protein HPODL_04346 [Ogataea parapolymorpha DL-1]ESW98735.1 hypothetical protein HPODL_04346 [Ogataea parapolymorpha DL-1]KAG7868216.1 hypothetical protein KL918_001874 [Ogataea parapolymorpha]KAG7874164.1 hypothetical protein KL916_001504 [Ogataea parapolymorpha]